jgi:multidrug efflux system membrane fusion protein
LFARVKLLASKPEPMMLVSDTAILTDQDRKYVYVLGEKNQAVRKDIRIGRSIDGLRIVSEGLKPGDKVIVHGIQKIFFPNMPVAPQMIKMGDPPAMPASAPDSQPEAGH